MYYILYILYVIYLLLFYYKTLASSSPPWKHTWYLSLSLYRSNFSPLLFSTLELLEEGCSDGMVAAQPLQKGAYVLQICTLQCTAMCFEEKRQHQPSNLPWRLSWCDECRAPFSCWSRPSTPRNEGLAWSAPAEGWLRELGGSYQLDQGSSCWTWYLVVLCPRRVWDGWCCGQETF